MSSLLPELAALRITAGRGVSLMMYPSAWNPSSSAPERLLEHNGHLDTGADEAGRSPGAVRRGYNLMGVLDLGRPGAGLDQPRPGQIAGTAQHWVDTIVRFYRDYRQDTFIFWPVGGDELAQVEAFAREVAPAARAAIDALPRG
jgi:hypothetical protein